MVRVFTTIGGTLLKLSCIRYGEPAHPLPRKVIARGIFQKATLELRPPCLGVLLLEHSDSMDITGPPHEYVTVSDKDTVRHLCTTLAAAVSTKHSAARVWKVETNDDFEGSLYPSARLREDGAEVLDPSDETVEESRIEHGDTFIVEFVQNGSFLVDPKNLPGKASSLPNSQVEVPAPLFSSGTDFFGRMSSKKSESGSPSSKIASSSKSANGYFKSFGSGNSRTQTVQEPGTLGLGNM